MSSRRADKLLPEVSSLFLIKVFTEEYRVQLLLLAFLTALATYVLFFQPGWLLDVLIFTLLWLQLELLYRQWWSEHKQERPILRLSKARIADSGVLLYVRNVGSKPAYEINVGVLTVPLSEYKKYLAILGYKGYMFKKIKGTLCGEFSLEVGLAPGRGDYVKIDFFKLKECTDVNNESIAFLLICYRSPVVALGLDYCTEALSIDFFWQTLNLSISLEDEPAPGILTKIPDMLRDAYTYWRIWKSLSEYKERAPARSL